MKMMSLFAVIELTFVWNEVSPLMLPGLFIESSFLISPYYFTRSSLLDALASPTWTCIVILQGTSQTQSMPFERFRRLYFPPKLHQYILVNLKKGDSDGRDTKS
jgi:hypothetical protein